MKFITKALLGLCLMASFTSTAALAADYTPEPVVTASSFYLRGDLGWSWLDTANNTDSVFLLGGIVIIALTSLRLTGVMLGTLPFLIAAAVFFGRRLRRYSRETQDQLAATNTIVEETLQAIASVKAFANEAFEIGRYEKANQRVLAAADHIDLDAGRLGECLQQRADQDFLASCHNSSISFTLDSWRVRPRASNPASTIPNRLRNLALVARSACSGSTL